MALSIVAHTPAAHDSLPGIEKSSRWYCDVYAGTAEVLIAAGFMDAQQLRPQKGRVVGYTAFTPGGEPCPPKQGTWRAPGFKAIRQGNDGTFSVEVTVAKDVQKLRKEALKAAEHEAEQARIDKEIVERGHKYRNWSLRQTFHGSCETWEGTKAQLQSAGLGAGLVFPGEPGGPQELRCKCPFGFDFLIRVPGWDGPKAAAGIYVAQSWYVRRAVKQREFIAQGRAVMREVWSSLGPYGTYCDKDLYRGTAAALVDAGLVPDLRYFPGQPGANKMQATYTKNWQPASTLNSSNFGALIRRLGKAGQFELIVPASQEEVERREALEKARLEERNRDESRQSVEREQLRKAANQAGNPQEDFRAERVKSVEVHLGLLWSEVFRKVDGAARFDISEGSDLWNDLAEAFRTISDAVRDADILLDRRHQAAVQTRLKLVSARNDNALQSVLRAAKSLRLVHSAPDEEQG